MLYANEEQIEARALEMRAAGLKLCGPCQQARALAEFAPSPYGSDGRLPVCGRHLAAHSAESRIAHAHWQIADPPLSER